MDMKIRCKQAISDPNFRSSLFSLNRHLKTIQVQLPLQNFTVHGFTGAPATLECMGVLPVHGFPAQVLSVRLAARHSVVPSDKPVL